jgi:hypothetical protein
MMKSYGKAQSIGAYGDAVFAAVVSGFVCIALYFWDLPEVWHLTLVIFMATILLAGLIAHGIQGIINQIHLSASHIARVITDRDPR